ncbi:6972_t:CDS:1, partial [Racocetra fulgida]
VLLFGLQLNCVKKNHEKKKQYNSLKLVSEASSSTLTKRAQKFATQIYNNFQTCNNEHYNQLDIPNLESLQYSVDTNFYTIEFNNQNKENQKQHAMSFVQVMDQNLIFREAYRNLTALEYNLQQEYIVSNTKIQIDDEMQKLIPIKLINIKTGFEVNLPENEQPDIDDSDIIEQVTNAIRKAGYRSIKDILNYIMPFLINQNILNSTNPSINLRISGNGRNVRRKIKHVIVTCAILDDKTNLYFPNHYYVVVLYPESENYDSLKNAMSLFLNELHELKELGIKINNITWNVNFYFSADWKFLCICLGFNGANCYYYCPWCNTNKDNREDLDAQWTISKSMDQLNTDFTIYNSHKNLPLFNMIPLENWVIDKLHTMLRITNCLWCLILNELQNDDLFDEFTHKVIIEEIKCISVQFQFWKERGSKSWNYTSLMGEDKIKVLKNFNLNLLFIPSRAAKIRNLWDKFSQLYDSLRDNSTDSNVFEKAAKKWLILFLTPSSGNWESNEEVISGLYLPSDITPYIHVLIYHVAEMMQIHRHWGLKAFSCSAVEKKNHQQVSYFFCKTLKDGEKNKDEKAAIKDLLNYKNRNLYFSYNDISCLSSKRQKIYIQ